MFSVPLVSFIHTIEDGSKCKLCNEKNTCFAQTPFLIGENNWVDEFMLLSFCKVRKYCGWRIGTYKKRYIIYFVTSMILALVLFWSKGINLSSICFGISSTMLLAVGVVDWNTQYIPLEYTIMIGVCGLIHLFADFSNWFEYVIGLIAVSGFLLLIDKVGTRLLASRYSDEEEGLTSVIGDGDIKLMAATGLLLGWKLNFFALGVGCITGSVIHLIRMKIKGSGTVLALGPYLSLGVYFTMICGEQLISWYLNMMGVIPY